MQLTEQKVKEKYEKYKQKAMKKFENKSYSKSLLYLKIAAHTAYYFYLDYKDEELESLMILLSKQLCLVENYSINNNNNVVFYDSFSIDNGGLVQQYLSALMAGGFNITYITERKDFLLKNSAIRSMLENYKNVVIFVVPSNKSDFEKSQFVYDTIVKTKCSKLLIHTKPSSAFANTAFYALPRAITRYKINLTDHTFWIGAGCIDYSFEFRPFGCTLSSSKRGISTKRIFHLPFYPIMNRIGFKGYPKEAEDKIILFSGGAYYKVFDKDDTYFKLTKTILDNCPNVVILYAGIGDSKKMQNKIEKFGLESRFILLGQRDDITEVFENCDIYLNTYPFGGGLMTQYAAQLGKPIVNYYTHNTAKVEEFVCQQGYIELSLNSIEDVAAKVKLLAESKQLRESLGKKIQSCVVTQQVFNEKFMKCIDTGINQIPYIDRTTFEEHTMDILDKLSYESDSKEYARNITKMLGISSIFQEPLMLIDAIKIIVKDKRLKSVFVNYTKII